MTPSSKAAYDRLAAVYNDTKTYPRLADVAEELGISVKTVRNKAGMLRRRHEKGDDVPALVSRIHTPSAGERRDAELGLMGYDPVLPGFRIDETTVELDADETPRRYFVRQSREPGEKFDMPEGHVVKGVSAFLDPEGRVLGKWVKTREGQEPTDVIELLKAALEGYESPRLISPAPEKTEASLLTLYPCNDWHIGLYAWGEETGIDWNLEIAERVIGGAIRDLIARSAPSRIGVILGGGDLLHRDTNQNRTEKSGNALDVSGRHEESVMAGGRLLVSMIDLALTRHEAVIVRLLKGNHDEYSTVALAYFLAAWYRNEPRVIIDLNPSLYWWFKFGQVLLGATHGHSVKIQEMPAIMAHRRAPDWGSTKFRYIHGFHLHHSAKFSTEGHGVISEIHQAPVPQDAWHHGSGFLSGRSLQSITYHQDYGEVSRSRVAILDGDAA